MGDVWPLLASVLLLVGNAFFVGAEFALISVRRTQLEPQAATGSRWARITLGATEHLSMMLAGAQLGVTLCSVGLGALAEPALTRLLRHPLEAASLSESFAEPIALVVALGIVTFMHVVLGEMVPKNLALAAPDRAAIALAPPLVTIVRFLRPAVAALNATAAGQLKLLRIQPKDEVTSAFTRDEVAGLVEESRREGLLDEEEHHMIAGALQFDERSVAKVLLPVDRLHTVTAGATPRDVEQLAARTGYSRFPVRSASDDLIGYLHIKDVLETDPVKRGRSIAGKWIRPLARVGVHDKLRTVLSVMQDSGAHLATVVDEQGGVRGVITLEDILEELVGEIRDENQRRR